MEKTRRIITSVVTGLLLSCLFIMILGHINIPRIWVLYRRGVETEGMIIKTEPRDHRSVLYSYNVKGRSYQNTDQGGVGYGNPPFEALKTQDKIKVFYDPLFPERSLSGHPRPALINELISVFMAGIIGPSLILFAVNIRRKNRSFGGTK